jgi:hypothetical protein
LRKVRGKRSGVKAVIFTIFGLWELTERAKTKQKSFKGHDSAIPLSRPRGSKITESINTPDIKKRVSERIMMKKLIIKFIVMKIIKWLLEMLF